MTTARPGKLNQEWPDANSASGDGKNGESFRLAVVTTMASSMS